MPSPRRLAIKPAMITSMTASASLAICLMLSAWSAHADEPQKRQPTIRISKQTTRITGPLDDEGYIDYVAAINEEFGQGVTRRNNFEVIVRSVLPSDGMSDRFRFAYFASLEMEIPDADSAVYRDFITYALAGKNDVQRRNELFEEHNRITSGPWTATEHPEAAAWVRKFDPQLDRLVLGSRRARFYTPYVADELDDKEPFPRVISMLLPTIQQIREVGRGLMIRAMGRIGSGDIDGAWSDIQAMHRVAHHVGQGFTLIEGLVGVAIDSMACTAEAHLLNSPNLTKEQLRRFLNDLEELPAIPSVAEKINKGERYAVLDAAITMARQVKRHGLIRMMKLIDDLSSTAAWKSRRYLTALRQDEPKLFAQAAENIDWNVTLELLNEWYDRLATAAGESDYEKRKELLEQIDTDIKKISANMQDTEELLASIAKQGEAKALGRKIGDLLVAILLPAVKPARLAEDMAIARRDTMRLAAALKLHLLEHGNLPGKLEELRPEYLKAIPNDPCSGAAFRMLRTDNQVMVYSVGRNGQDDQGRTYEDAEKLQQQDATWDDIVVKLAL